jgi:hypothetical protein
MPSTTRPIVDWSCEPRISVFDPPMHLVASVAEANATRQETRAGECGRGPIAAGCEGPGQGVLLNRGVYWQKSAQVVSINPG